MRLRSGGLSDIRLDMDLSLRPPPPPFEQQLNLVDVMGGGGAATAAEEEEEERCYHCSQLASTAQTGDGSKERGEERRERAAYIT